MRQTILVVDDQDDEREAMAHLLRRHGYAVESATNGQEALDLLRDDNALPSLVLLDLNMPVMNGWEFLFHVSRDRALCHVPVIVASGSPVVPDAIAVPPIVTFLAKPVRPPVIVKLIEDTLRVPAVARAPTVNDCAVSTIEDVDTEPYAAPRGQRAPPASA